MPPGQSHYWFFDDPRDLHGWVFQATAHPECADDESIAAETRVEVSELFVLCQRREVQGTTYRFQLNVTVTNYSGSWAPYSLWVVTMPAENYQRARPSNDSNPRRNTSRRKATGTGNQA